MRIGYVSTYPPVECGIATYTSYLNEAVKKIKSETFVVSQLGAQGKNVYAVFDPTNNCIGADIFNFSSKLTPDIIHIQHEFGIFGSQEGVQVIEVILRFKLVGVPVITTLHTVYDDYTDEQKLIIRLILEESSGIIVHEQYQKEILLNLFGNQFDKKVHYIPHGVRTIKTNDNGKEKLDLKDKKIVLLCGYFRPTKGFDRVVKFFPKIVENIDNAILLIAGKSRGLMYMDYQRDFFELINNSPVTDNIIVLRGQFPQHTFDTIVSSADIVCLPYEKSGQSGILAQCFAFKKPVVTTNLKPFAVSLAESGGGLIANSDDEFTNSIIKTLSDNNLRHSMEKKISQYVKNKVSWSKVAIKHIELYQSVVRVPYGKARYVYWD